VLRPAVHAGPVCLLAPLRAVEGVWGAMVVAPPAMLSPSTTTTSAALLRLVCIAHRLGSAPVAEPARHVGLRPTARAGRRQRGRPADASAGRAVAERWRRWPWGDLTRPRARCERGVSSAVGAAALSGGPPPAQASEGAVAAQGVGDALVQQRPPVQTLGGGRQGSACAGLRRMPHRGATGKRAQRTDEPRRLRGESTRVWRQSPRGFVPKTCQASWRARPGASAAVVPSGARAGPAPLDAGQPGVRDGGSRGVRAAGGGCAAAAPSRGAVWTAIAGCCPRSRDQATRGHGAASRVRGRQAALSSPRFNRRATPSRLLGLRSVQEPGSTMGPDRR
jgi:hypothetical protein